MEVEQRDELEIALHKKDERPPFLSGVYYFVSSIVVTMLFLYLFYNLGRLDLSSTLGVHFAKVFVMTFFVGIGLTAISLLVGAVIGFKKCFSQKLVVKIFSIVLFCLSILIIIGIVTLIVLKFINL